MPSVALTKSAAQGLLGSYTPIIDKYINSEKFSIEGIKSQLEAKLKAVEALSIQVYNKLGYSGTLEQMETKFNQNVQMAKQGVQALSGTNLDKVFLSSLRKATAYTENNQQIYNEFLSFLENKVVSRNSEAIENLEGEIATELFNSLGKELTGTLTISNSGRTRYASSGRFAGYKFSRAFSNLSKRVQNEVANYISKHKEEITLNSNTVTDNGLSISWLVENIDINSFLKMNAHERTLLFNKYPGILEQLNIAFKNEILTNCSGTSSDYLSKAIDKVILKRGGTTAFFVGNNIKDMTGILGEIQTLYYLLVITEGKIDSDMGWVGGIGNPHSDIILRDGLRNYGIQVKNTSLDEAMHEIEFQTFNTTKAGSSYIGGGVLDFWNTSHALTELEKFAPLDLFESMQTILAMETFNIEYLWQNGKAQAASNPEFEDVRWEIESYAAKAQQIAQLFSISMMYMQTDFQSNTQSNVLYFVAGGIVKSAATILSQIIKELESELHSFKLTMKNKGTLAENQKTIVDYFNAEKGKGQHVLHFALQSSFKF